MKANEQLQSLNVELKKKSAEEKVNIWRKVADDLERPTRIRRIVNLSKINQLVREDEIALVPGKVLGGGDLEKKVTVAAFNFSKQAVDKIKSKNGKAIHISELIKSNPKGSKVRIVG